MNLFDYLKNIPDALDKCTFQPMEIHGDWRSQYELNIHTPKFAETLTQGSQSIRNTPQQPQIRATQMNLEFVPTQILDSSDNHGRVDGYETPSNKKQFISSITTSQTQESYIPGRICNFRVFG